MSKESVKQFDQKVMQKLTEKQPQSQLVLNNSLSMSAGSKLGCFNSSAPSEYYNQQINIFEMQQALRIQDEQNACATNSLLENLVQPPFFKVERIDRDDQHSHQSDSNCQNNQGEPSERETSFNNKYENDSESLVYDEEPFG